MNDNHDPRDTNHETELTLAALDELRLALGAEADISATPAAAARPVSTIMCPSHPWDQ